MVPWNAARAKVQIKLSIQRLRTLQEKRLALAKKSRREIADLLQKSRTETAKLRVEGLIQDDIYVELLELLELYCEKLQARFNLLDASVGTEPDPTIADAVCAVVYAAPRTELKELQVLREILMHKFGRTFSLSLLPSDQPPPDSVPSRIASKLALYTPPDELVDAYLGEIAKAYGVPYLAVLDPARGGPETGVGGEGDEGGEGNARDGPGDGQEKEIEKVTKTSQGSFLETLGNSGDKDIPSFGATTKTAAAPAPPVTAPTTTPAAQKLTMDEELAQRFERLKNLR